MGKLETICNVEEQFRNSNGEYVPLICRKLKGCLEGVDREPHCAASARRRNPERATRVEGPQTTKMCGWNLVPGGGVEPPRPEGRRILSPLRLPVPPSRLKGGSD
jgi:hypothetical protein